MQGSVLLVDDNVGLRTGLASILEDEGLDTRQAERGDEAIRLVKEVRFDLLILDLNLPDMTGVRLYSTVSQDVIGARFVFMTAEASEELIDEALRLQPLRLLRKPFEVKLFRDLVRSAI
jgi:CheY-like chemotaxis protein